MFVSRLGVVERLIHQGNKVDKSIRDYSMIFVNYEGTTDRDSHPHKTGRTKGINWCELFQSMTAAYSGELEWSLNRYAIEMAKVRSSYNVAAR